jgi:hypothetical protein
VQRKYDLASYDHHFCLKTPGQLLIAILFLSRNLALPFLAFLGPLLGFNSDSAAFMKSGLSLAGLLAASPAALVLLSLCRRTPVASQVPRWIWAHGRALLAIAALGDCAVGVSAAPIWHGESNPTVPWSILTAAFDLYFLTYILAVRRVRDTFADFPARTEEARRASA